jgi:hypothetical protein
MATRERVLLAGAGALIPMLANLYVVDYEQVILKLTVIVFVFYVVKLVVLFGVGCFIGYINREHVSRANIVQAGLGVPALLIAAFNGSQYNTLAKNRPTASVRSGWSILRTVYAQNSSQGAPARSAYKTFSLPPETAKDQILRGLGVASLQRSYFVIAAAYKDSDQAEQAVLLIRQKTAALDPEIYAPIKSGGVYSVVIGAQKTFLDAQQIRTIARKSGLSRTFIWNFALGAPVPETPL